MASGHLTRDESAPLNEQLSHDAVGNEGHLRVRKGCCKKESSQMLHTTGKLHLTTNTTDIFLAVG